MTYNGVELYVKDNKAGVLVSPGYGAGWSTWNNPKIAYDKRVIDFRLEHKGQNVTEEEADKYFESIGYKETYFGGYGSLVLEFVEFDKPFYIHEYDGAEWIVRDTEFTTFRKHEEGEIDG